MTSMITKKTMEATSIINETIKLYRLEDKLSDVEKKFLGFEYNDKNLSLTDTQEIDHQLRYFTENYAYNIVNNVAVKVKNELDSESKIVFNTYENSDLETFFVNRMALLLSNVNIIYKENKNITSLVCTLDYFKQCLNKGDNFSAELMWNELVKTSLPLSERTEFYLMSALMFNALRNPMAAETMLNLIISDDRIDNDHKFMRVKAMYILSMNYLRGNPEIFRDSKKAKSILNEAYNILDLELGNEYEFIKLFNRNGYALALFQEGKTEECIQIMEEKILAISKIIDEKNKYYNLHKVVLVYNLYQCFKRDGQLRKAEDTLRKAISLDVNDVEYRYDLVRFLIEYNRFEEAEKELIILENSFDYDVYYQNAYLGYVYFEKEDYNKAMNYFKKAYEYNHQLNNEEENLYNYLVTLKACNEMDEIKFLKKKYDNFKFSEFKEEIEEIFYEE